MLPSATGKTQTAEALNLIEIVSLFTGAGGLDFSLESTGNFDVTTRVETEPEYCRTISACQKSGLLGEGVILESDFRVVDPTTIWSNSKSQLRGVVGGPPCESYSVFGLRKGRHDPRGELLFQLVEWTDRSGADFFIIENVPFLTQGPNRAAFEDLLEQFDSRGFAVDFRILNAADYGAATTRKRVIVTGLRDGAALDFPRATHADPKVAGEQNSRLPWVTSGDVLDGLPPPSASRPGSPSGHVLIAHTDAVAQRFAALAPGTKDPVRRRQKLDWNRPSPSLVAGNLTGTRSHIHPLEPRELTNRECARIQGFPDSYEFSGSRAAVAKQIANAVPIPLGQKVGEAIGRQLNAHAGASGRRRFHVLK